MVDLEKLAIKRDRGYLVRLVVLLALGIGASLFLWRGLTGEGMTGCVANAMLGSDAKSE